MATILPEPEAGAPVEASAQAPGDPKPGLVNPVLGAALPAGAAATG